ncbi:response regulator transcription factor [Polluticaenibacter yanchengensis]|uniref:Response regulator transcription factor n=1 Tax=Polluticaenibacter yanchengensis TaxID=3014562 RepID=A0ABT4UPG8_9BACT|nr:response regulator transcription factor [Chitinophagaceae bacterium LY-5]
MNIHNQLNILLVEDEENLHETLKLNLEMEGYLVTSAFNGAEALEKVKSEYFQLIILDVMLPILDGFSVLENIRLAKIESPVLILSAKNASADRINGLKIGADDYLTKPFELEELLLRIEKLIEKNKKNITVSGSNEEQYKFGGHSIDFKAQIAYLANGEQISLSKKEAMLLKLLVDHPNEVITREKILLAVWGYNVFPSTRTIDNFILNFRKYFETDTKNPKHFHSVRGMGYKFSP